MKRAENELYEDYIIRRKEANKSLKTKLSGKLVWDSKTNGTYVKKIHWDKRNIKTSDKK